jgi:hypothetical protein
VDTATRLMRGGRDELLAPRRRAYVATMKRLSGLLALSLSLVVATPAAAEPSVPTIEALAYDGTQLAFGAGTCVFAGPPPTGPPAPLALDGCETPAAGR